MSMGFTVAGCELWVAGYRLLVVWEPMRRRTPHWVIPLRYREETSTIILDSRTSGKS
jgi:hypothetical protein